MNKGHGLVLSHKWKMSKKSSFCARILNVFHALYPFWLWQSSLMKIPIFNSFPRVPSIHYDVKKSISNLTAKALEDSKDRGKKEHTVITCIYAVKQLGHKQEALHYMMVAALAHTSSMPAFAPAKNAEEEGNKGGNSDNDEEQSKMERRWKIEVVCILHRSNAWGHGKIDGWGACHDEKEVEMDYVTQTEHEQQIIIGWVPSIHYNVKKSFGISTAEGLKIFRSPGKKEHAVIMCILASPKWDATSRETSLRGGSHTMAHTSSTAAILITGRGMKMGANGIDDKSDEIVRCLYQN